MSIKVYTDGAAKGNWSWGWGVYIQLNDEEKDLYGGNPETTNNQMEMQAALEALVFKDKMSNRALYWFKLFRQGITEWIHKWKLNNDNGKNQLQTVIYG